MVGLVLLALVMAASCTGNGCRSCESCKKCGEEKQPEPSVTGPQAGATGPSAQAGETGEPAPGETVGGPSRPGAKDAETAEPAIPSGAEEAREERLKAITEKGEGTNKPETPAGLNARVVKSNFVELSWRDTSDNETSFQVDRRGEDETFTAIQRLPANRENMKDGPLDPDTYSYRVRALSRKGASPFAGPVEVTITTPKEAPAAPGNLTATAQPSGEILLNWSANSQNAGYYRMERSGSDTGWLDLAVLNPDLTSYQDVNPESGVEYSYRVFAGNEAGESGPSNVATAMAEEDDEIPEAPTNLEGSVAGPNLVVLEWQDNSDNENKFIVEKFHPAAGRFIAVKEVARNTAKSMMGNLSRGETGKYRVKAANLTGESDPSKSVTVTTEGEALHTYMMEVAPGQMTVEEPDDPTLPRLEIQDVRQEGGDLAARVTVHNPNPEVQLENVYLLAAESDAEGIVFKDCDRGPSSCSVSEGLDTGNPVGYQYVEGGYLGEAPLGGELETYDLKNRQRQIAVRDIWPACGQVDTDWRIGGLTGPATIALNLYATQSPADFTKDRRYDNDLPMFMIETYSVGLEDGVHEPGARSNPTARPVSSLSPGDVFAVNISVEAADWMESQGEIGKIELDPEAHYVYWSTLAYVLNYDPEVIRPIESSMVTDEGARLRPKVRDPRVDDPAADGWTQEGSFSFTAWFPDQGWIQSIYSYPLFKTQQGPDGEPECVHCFEEGFLDEEGRLQGPDPEPEAFLSVIYFEVVGDPGSGSPLRLFPKPETLTDPKTTNGTLLPIPCKRLDPEERKILTGSSVCNPPDKTLANYQDDRSYHAWKEINKVLPPTFQLPGDYQVQEAYVCVE
ncbi:MAG: fibronectin type III domain-containing protein [bacterium]